MIWINADDVIAIHGQIIKKSGGSEGNMPKIENGVRIRSVSGTKSGTVQCSNGNIKLYNGFRFRYAS